MLHCLAFGKFDVVAGSMGRWLQRTRQETCLPQEGARERGGNNWSDAYRSAYGNFMLMTASSFMGYYGVDNKAYYDMLLPNVKLMQQGNPMKNQYGQYGYWLTTKEAGSISYSISSSGSNEAFIPLFVTNTWVELNGKPSGGGDGRDWLDKTQIGLESYSLPNSSKEQLFKYAAKTDASIDNLKYVKGVKAAGKVLVVAGVVATGYEVYDDVFNKGNYYSAGTRAAVLGIGLAATAIPVAGWAVAGGIGLADAIWGDQFYNWVELNLRKKP